jgi:hypothetical protein
VVDRFAHATDRRFLIWFLAYMWVTIFARCVGSGSATAPAPSSADRRALFTSLPDVACHLPLTVEVVASFPSAIVRDVAAYAAVRCVIG